MASVEGSRSSKTPPSEFEEYRLLKLLGRGAKGDVYLAIDTLLDRAVAIKFISGEPDESARERFFVEARAIARLSHPNVVAVYRVGEVRRQPFLVSELIRGRNLAEIDRPRPAELMRIAVALARGLAAAHRHGVLHRDLKPANAMLTQDGEVKLLDFGLAELLDGRPDSGGARASSSPEPTLWGTPLYLAPEIWRAESASYRSDVYALGVMLYELATGQAPHAGLPVAELRRAAESDDVPPLSTRAPELDPRFAQIVDRCLARDPIRRFESAEALREALERISLESTPTLSIPAGNPYRGLAAFEAEHRGLFFGRAAEVRAIVERLRSGPFVLVTGDSGAGKSSLCRAGVLPSVAEGVLGAGLSWTVVRMVPGKRPLSSLAMALTKPLGSNEAVVTAQLQAEPWAMTRELRRRGAGMLLFVDQLEELLTVSDRAQANTVAELLGMWATNDTGLRLLCSVRADFLARLAALPGLGEEVGRALFFLDPLTATGVRQAITEPAAQLGFRFESEEMVEELAQSVERAAGGLPLLQFALSELWQSRDLERRIIPRSALESLGGVEGALASHADGIIGHLAPSQRELAQRIFLRLATAEGTRIRRSEAELIDAAGETGRTVLDVLVRGRLLVAGEGREAQLGTYEIAHEALLANWGTLRGWLSRDGDRRAVRARLERAAGEWERLGRTPEALWRDRQLAESAAINSDDLGPKERDFLAASRSGERHRRWRRRVLLVGTPVVLASLYGAIQLKASHDLHLRVDHHLAAAATALASADERNAAVEQLRKDALDSFDIGDRALGEDLWSRGLALASDAEHNQVVAASALETALTLDGRRADVRRRFAALLYQRALWAERNHRHQQLDDLLSRLAAYDESGEFQRRWRAPAQLAVATRPEGATVSLSHYQSGAGRRLLSEERTLGTAPLNQVQLAPGSYGLMFTLPGRPPVRLPLLLARGESQHLVIDLPAHVPDNYVYIPKGRFLFGSDTDDSFRRGYLTAPPLHPITTDAYLIGRTEVTFADWIQFLEALPPGERERRRPAASPRSVLAGLELKQLANGRWQLHLQPTTQLYRAIAGESLHYQHRTRRALQDWRRFPVSGISWDDALAYVAWLDRTGRVPGARLCSEREWERAARGADERTYPHGDSVEADDANHDMTYGRDPLAFGPDEVGSHPASDSPFGVADLAGNVWELTRSVMRSEAGVIRGGSWYQDHTTCRSDNREPIERSMRTLVVGLRVCAMPPAE